MKTIIMGILQLFLQFIRGKKMILPGHPIEELTRTLCNEKEKVIIPTSNKQVHEGVMKYWIQRYSLFSRFDEGILFDEEGLFSVTPEEIAKHHADICKGSSVIIDAFTGIGGNAIQFAAMGMQVIAIDIDPKKIHYAKHNATIYGVAHRINFIVGDFFEIAPTLKADVIFLSPPWGGPTYIKAGTFDIENMLKPRNGFELFQIAQAIAPSIIYFLPRTVDMDQLDALSRLSSPPLKYKVEENYVQNEIKAITAYFGKIINA